MSRADLRVARARPFARGAVALVGLVACLPACMHRSPGIEVEWMVMPPAASLVLAHADLGLDALMVTSLELVPCPTRMPQPATHTHENMDAWPVGDMPTPRAMPLAPGAYCDVRVGLSVPEAAPRETVLRVGCADGRVPIALSATERSASLVLTFPASLDVSRTGETDIDRQRVFDALVRGIVVDRIDCVSSSETEPTTQP